MTKLKSLSASMVLLSMLGTTVAQTKSDPQKTTLDLNGKNVKRLEVNQSQIGYTSTRVFYTIREHRAIVVLHIDNSKKEFPITGKVCLFGKDVTADGMEKWLNNQHSDGLFPEVPEPVKTEKLSAKSCEMLKSKMLGQTSVNSVRYTKFTVEFKLKETKINDQLVVKEFTDKATVYVEAK